MKITIDTKEDSPEEIKKVVSFLTQFTEGRIVSNENIFDKEEMPKENIMNIFDVNKSSKETKEKTDDDIPEVQVY